MNQIGRVIGFICLTGLIGCGSESSIEPQNIQGSNEGAVLDQQRKILAVRDSDPTQPTDNSACWEYCQRIGNSIQQCIDTCGPHS